VLPAGVVVVPEQPDRLATVMSTVDPGVAVCPPLGL